MGIVVAIDGPSGSGKSSVSLAVARQLQLAYLTRGPCIAQPPGGASI